MLKKPRILFLAVLLVLAVSFGAHAQQAKTLTQTSTIDALMSGIYDGKMTLQELKLHGDIGLGTIQSLDGEMILLDGTVYQVKADGTVHVPGPAETTPFAAVTFFEPDMEKTLPGGIDMKRLTDEIDAVLPTTNVIYALRIEGRFKRVKARSVPRQNKPYRPLEEVVKTQSIFDFENVEGVIVGLRCPPFMKGINVPGYHLHFLTKDRKAGGHVLGLTVDKAVAKIDRINSFYVALPESQDFYRLNTDTDRTGAVSAVETRN
jgi:acetolactate decarboxylase